MPERRLNAIAFAHMIKALQDGPCSPYELVVPTGLHVRTLYAYLHAMNRVGAVHIAGWEKNSRDTETTPVYALGPGRNKPKRVLSDAQKQARRREKRRAVALLHTMAGTTNAEA